MYWKNYNKIITFKGPCLLGAISAKRLYFNPSLCSLSGTNNFQKNIPQKMTIGTLIKIKQDASYVVAQYA